MAKLTDSKLHKLIKKYRQKLDNHNNEWKDICFKINRQGEILSVPSIYDHERHNAKGARLFEEMVKELETYEPFEKDN